MRVVHQQSAELEGFWAVGTRMLYQLLPEDKFKDIVENYEALGPWSVLELAAKRETGSEGYYGYPDLNLVPFSKLVWNT